MVECRDASLDPQRLSELLTDLLKAWKENEQVAVTLQFAWTNVSGARHNKQL